MREINESDGGAPENSPVDQAAEQFNVLPARAIADALSGELALYVQAERQEYRHRLAAAAARDILHDAAAVTDLIALVMNAETGVGEVPDATLARAAALAQRLTNLAITLQSEPD